MATGYLNADYYNILNHNLNWIITNDVRMRRAEKKANSEIVKETINSLINAMKKESELFDELYHHLLYAGSYWEGLRVRKPTEFDMQMILELPFTKDEVDIIMPPWKQANWTNGQLPTRKNTRPKNHSKKESKDTFLQCRLRYDITELLEINETYARLPNEDYDTMISFFDEENYLLRPRVQSWLKELITKAVNSQHFVWPYSVTDIQPSQHGPAFNFYITTDIGDDEIYVDLVPAIHGRNYPIPEIIYKSKNFNRLNKIAKNFWVMIPKQYKDSSPRNGETFWKISFPKAEKHLLPTDGCCAKDLVKLFKLLRDTQQWDKLVSYHIKTLFLLETDNFPNAEHWPHEEIGQLFMNMLTKLKTALGKKRLSFYFNRNANIFSGTDAATLEGYANQIDIIVDDIQNNPDNVFEYFPQANPDPVFDHFLKANRDNDMKYFPQANAVKVIDDIPESWDERDDVCGCVLM